jgi:hypothetical protein
LPTLEIDIPLREPLFNKVRFTYLGRSGETAEYPEHALLHLRTARLQPLEGCLPGRLGGDPWRLNYLRNLPYFCLELVQGLARECFDFVVSPPSRFPHAAPYRSAFLREWGPAHDLSDCFVRRSESYAGSGASFASHCRALDFRGDADLRACRSILIVDDILWRGVTAAALLFHLQRRGLPRSARIALACPLWIT